MDRKLQDVHITMSDNEIVLRAIYIASINFGAGFMRIDFSESFNPVSKSIGPNYQKTLLIPCLTGIKITID